MQALKLQRLLGAPDLHPATPWRTDMPGRRQGKNMQTQGGL